MGSGERLRVECEHLQLGSNRRASGGASVGSGERLRVGCGHLQFGSKRRASGGASVGSGERLPTKLNPWSVGGATSIWHFGTYAHLPIGKIAILNCVEMCQYSFPKLLAIIMSYVQICSTIMYTSSKASHNNLRNDALALHVAALAKNCRIMRELGRHLITGIRPYARFQVSSEVAQYTTIFSQSSHVECKRIVPESVV